LIMHHNIEIIRNLPAFQSVSVFVLYYNERRIISVSSLD